MWEAAVKGIIAEFKKCEEAGITVAAVAMSYVCIDTMAYLSMPDGQEVQTDGTMTAGLVQAVAWNC